MNMTMSTTDVDYGDNSTEDECCCCSMMMYFHFSFSNDVFLFESWTTQSVFEIIAAIILSTLLAIVLEAIKHYSVRYQKQKVVFEDQELKSIKDGREHRNCHSLSTEELIKSKLLVTPVSTRFVLTVLHVLQLTIAYILMLIVMTYNAYIFIACIVGIGIGYFVSPIINPNVN